MTPAARIVVLVLAALALLAGSPAPVAAGPAGVRNAWVRLPPPGTPAAAYFTLHNRTDQGLTLVGATSPDCQRVEIHRSVVEDGMARMEPAGPLEIPPGGYPRLRTAWPASDARAAEGTRSGGAGRA